MTAGLLLSVEAELLSAVRVPAPVAVTKLQITLPDHLPADEVARRINKRLIRPVAAHLTAFL